MKTVAIRVVLNLNFLLFRFIVMEVDDKLMDGIVFQWPWWNLQTALFRGRFVRLT